MRLGVKGKEENEVLRWLLEHGGTADGISIREFGAMGRGLMCTRTKVAESAVLTVPMEVVMSGSKARELVRRKYGTEIGREEEAIAVTLLAERARGERSAWAPYLRLLPEKIVTLQSMSNEELALLQNERLAARGRHWRNVAKAAGERLRPTLISAAREACPIGDDACVTAHSSGEAYAWARSIIDSRALTFRGSRYLVPVADFVNYGPQPNSSSRDHEGGQFFLRYHRLEAGVVRTFADRPCGAGEHLFEDYGDNSNLVYLEHHGFVPETNPFDCVFLELPGIDDGRGPSDLTNARVEFLRALGERGPPSNCVRGSLSLVSTSLIRYLAAGALDFETATRCAEEVRRRDSPVAHECIDDSIATNRLCSAVADAIRAYPTSLTDDDVELSERSNRSEGATLALKYRRAQKTLLAHLSRECTRQECAMDSPMTTATVATKIGSLEERVAAFNVWARSRGWPAFAIEARVLPTHGGRVGAVATRTIAKQEAYISIPESDCLSANAARADPTLGPALADTFDDFDALLFLLLREVFALLNDDDEDNWKLVGRWRPYLALLPGVDEVLAQIAARRHGLEFQPTAPSVPGAPLLWADDEATMRVVAGSWLSGSALERAATTYLSSVRSRWNRTTIAFRGSSRLQAEFGRETDLALSWPIYRWAVHILDSRSIWWKGTRNLVPGLDLVNAANSDELPPFAPVHRTVLTDNHLAVTRAATVFHLDDQVLEDYGQPNHVLFLYHGFVLPVNKHDCVRLDLAIYPADPLEYANLQSRLYVAGFRSPVFVACVRPNMSQRAINRVYEFLAVKRGIDPPYKGVPSVQLLQAFAGEVNDRLGAYATDLPSPADQPLAAKMLLNNEKRLLLELSEEISEQARECESQTKGD